MVDHDNPLLALRMNDVADVVGGVIKDQRRAILAHVNRLHELHRSELRGLAGPMSPRSLASNQLYMRVTALESELRRYRKSGVLPRSPDPDLRVKSDR